MISNLRGAPVHPLPGGLSQQIEQGNLALGGNPASPGSAGTLPGNENPVGPYGAGAVFTPSPASIFPFPPAACTLYQAVIPSGIDAGTLSYDLGEVLSQMPASAQSAFHAAMTKWQSDYPTAPPAVLVLGTRERNPKAVPVFQLFLCRPPTQYDPILDSHPPIQPGTDRSKIFAAGYRLFFPDVVLNASTGQDIFGADQGSITVDGPFPWWVLYVNESMVNFAVNYIKTTPDAFTAQGQTDYEGQLVSGFENSLLRGAVSGIASANPIVGLGVAAGNFIVSGFMTLLSWFGSSNPPPAWLTKLLPMKGLRGDTSLTLAAGPPSFGESYVDWGNGAHECRRAIITPTPFGKYTVEDGYLEVVRRITGQSSSSWKTWALIALGVGAGYYLLKE